MSAQSSPLTNIKVLDFSQNLPGPYATSLLVSMGAEVIKVEPPKGDQARAIRPLFDLVNKGKKSIVLDFKKAEDRKKAKTLSSKVDVLLEGFRPHVMKKYELDYNSLKEQNQKLIYCSLSGYGQEGPYRNDPAHDLNFQAFSGVSHMQRGSKENPQSISLPIADLSGGLKAYASIMTALYHREQTNLGCFLDISLNDTLTDWSSIWYEGLNPKTLDFTHFIRKISEKTPAIFSEFINKQLLALKNSSVDNYLDRLKLHVLPHYGLYKTKDKKYLCLGIVNENNSWQDLCIVLNLPTWIKKLPIIKRIIYSPLLKRKLQAAFYKEDMSTMLEKLRAKKIPISPVLLPSESKKILEQRTPILKNKVPVTQHNTHLTSPHLNQHDATITHEYSEEKKFNAHD
jgi:crotonobetainyl-CoA:carnitine CoA-transferase CaiB-like acyl-CoA transferase